MRKSRLTEEQIVGILQKSFAGAKTCDLIRLDDVRVFAFPACRRDCRLLARIRR
jgi:hypothetical protein